MGNRRGSYYIEICFRKWPKMGIDGQEVPYA